MKAIEEYAVVCTTPPLFFWGGYDPVVKYYCSSSAIVTSAGLIFIDPLPLALEALKSLLSEASQPPAAIVLTSGNHQRWSSTLSQQLSLPLYAPIGAGEEIIASHFYQPGDQVMGLCSIALPGFGPGEAALLEESSRILILGDCLIPTEEGLMLLPKKYCEDRRLAVRSLARLKEVAPNILILAHGLPIVKNVAQRFIDVCLPIDF
jgi:glyoxylase-like metal-dependent hydrolase (beta-lactamase superfamily II)